MEEYDFLFDEDNRYCVFPIKHDDIWKEYKKQLNSFWTAETIDYTADKSDWNKLTKDEKYFIEHILAFFAGSDGIVLENLITDFCQRISILEVQYAYRVQAMMETIHGETYALLIDTLIDNEDRKQELFNAIQTIDCIKQKANWAIKWIDVEQKFSIRLLAFAMVEGIFFSGSFCAIFWLKNRGLMVKALGTSNELIARDEAMHVNFAVLLYSKIKNKVEPDIFYEMLKEAVKIETHFICESLPCRLIGMNSDLMKQYIEYVADRLSIQLGYNKIYKSENPFDFMNDVGLDGKSNFFEKRVTEYRIATHEGNKEFILDEDF